MKLFFLILISLTFTESQQQEKQQQQCDPASNSGCEQFYKQEYASPLLPGHTCPNFVKKTRNDPQGLIEMITGDLENSKLLKFKQKSLSRSPPLSLLYIKGEKPGQEFVICSTPKSGVTRSRLLLLRVAGLKGKTMHSPGRWNQNVVAYLSPEEKLRILTNPNITRVRLVRNPYIRAISMYQDKVVNEPGRIRDWGFESMPPSFDEFIEKYAERLQKGMSINQHYMAQYHQCWGDMGFSFDYVLKIEQQKHWFPCFLEKFNLWQYAMRGWPGQNDCYLSTPDVPCNGPFQDDSGLVVFDKNASRGDGVDAQHKTDSQLKFAKFYNDQFTLARVSKIFKEDIVQFDYPYANIMFEGQPF